MFNICLELHLYNYSRPTANQGYTPLYVYSSFLPLQSSPVRHWCLRCGFYQHNYWSWGPISPCFIFLPWYPSVLQDTIPSLNTECVETAIMLGRGLLSVSGSQPTHHHWLTLLARVVAHKDTSFSLICKLDIFLIDIIFFCIFGQYIELPQILRYALPSVFGCTYFLPLLLAYAVVLSPCKCM